MSVFLHFTEIYRTLVQAFTNETTISLLKNFQKSPFFVVLLLKIAVFMNNFGEIRPDSDCLWRISLFIRQLMTHLLYDALLYLTHLIYHAYWIFVQYIQNMWGIFGGFLCKMLYMCSVFYMIFVQFLGVIKCLNNPFFTICRIANTKKPHRAIFKVTDSYLESWYLSKIYP